MNNLETKGETKCQSCTPCVVENAKRKPFEVNTQRLSEELDAVSTDTTGPVAPAAIEGNVYFQLVVDASTGYTQKFPFKKEKSDAERAILQ